MKLIALYGGTFNPVHLGHIGAVSQLHAEIGFEKVLFLPNAIPPHRPQTQVSGRHRLEMLEMATADYPAFEVNDFELVQAEKYGNTSYSVHSVLHFHSLLKEDEKLVFIMGMDSYLNFTQWHQWEVILKHVSLVVMRREADMTAEPKANYLADRHIDLQTLKSSPQHGIYFATNKMIPISSTQIRELLHLSKVRYTEQNHCFTNKNPLLTTLDAKVLNYINQHQLYC